VVFCFCSWCLFFTSDQLFWFFPLFCTFVFYAVFFLFCFVLVGSCKFFLFFFATLFFLSCLFGVFLRGVLYFDVCRALSLVCVRAALFGFSSVALPFRPVSWGGSLVCLFCAGYRCPSLARSVCCGRCLARVLTWVLIRVRWTVVCRRAGFAV